MKRRSLLQSGAWALPSLVLAQTASPGAGSVTVGVLLEIGVPTTWIPQLREALARVGWRDGGNLRLEVRSFDARTEHRDAAVDALLGLNPTLVIALHEGLALAIRRRNERLPIVLAFGHDPVAAGLAASLQRPGGSVTGLVRMFDDLQPKLFELARQLAPKARRIGGMFFQTSESASRSEATVERSRELARRLAAEYLPLPVREAGEIERIVGSLRPAADHVLLVSSDPALYPHFARIAALAREAKLPTVSQSATFVRRGGLMSYASDSAQYALRIAQITDKLLRGARPGDIPIEQPTLFKLVLNQRTAREIGLTIPPSLLARVDELID